MIKKRHWFIFLQKTRWRKLSVLHFSFELDNGGIITFQLHTFVEKIKKTLRIRERWKRHTNCIDLRQTFETGEISPIFLETLWCSAQVWKMKIVGIGWKVRMWKGILNLILPQIKHHRPHWLLLIKRQFLHSSLCVCRLPIEGSRYLCITLIAQNKQTSRDVSQLDKSTKLFC